MAKNAAALTLARVELMTGKVVVGDHICNLRRIVPRTPWKVSHLRNKSDYLAGWSVNHCICDHA